MLKRSSVAGFLGLTLCLAPGALGAPPANNTCANAQNIVLAANSSVNVSGTTVEATTDITGVNECLSGTNSPDVWYTVTAPASGTLTASMCAGGASFDTMISIHAGAGACPGALISCNDDDPACGTNSTVSINATAGTVYRIRVAGYQGGSGTFNLRVTHGPTGGGGPTEPPDPTTGPDVITSVIVDVSRTVSGATSSYAVGTTSCDIGDYPVIWVDQSTYLPDYNDTQHPVISQNIFRLRTYDGATYSRFEQLGQGWLKHGFVSTNFTSTATCGTCGTTQAWRYSTQTYTNFGGDVLGVGCSDTYGSSLNGNWSGLGPKSIVNSTLGTSPFVKGTGTGDATIRSRIQVPTADTTGQPTGTRYYAEAQYVTADDAQFIRPDQTVATNGLNNASWRELAATSINSSSVGFVGSTVPQQPAIFAWKIADPSVTLVSADHDDAANPATGYRAPDGGPQYPAGTTFVRSRYWVAAKVTPLAGGLYRYEYAVHNLNSDRAGAAFSVPFPDDASLPSNFSFHAPQYHSGEPYSNSPWTMSKVPGRLRFEAPNLTNANTSALRWGTLYNFGFTTSVAPTNGNATITLFKTGTPTGVDAVNVPVPTVPAGCLADISEIGGTSEDPGNPDGQLTVDDIIVFINVFGDGTGCPGAAPCNAADITGLGGPPEVADGQLTVDDVIAFFNSFSDGCV